MSSSAVAGSLGVAGPLMKVGFMEIAAFRLKPIMLLSGYPVIILANYFLYSAIFKNRTEVAGYGLTEVITYLSIVWFIRAGLKTDADRITGYRVRSGDVSIDMARPVYYPVLVFWQATGRALGRTAFISLPLVLMASLVIPILRPASASHFLAFAASLLLSYMMAFSVYLLVGISSFFLEFNLGFSWTVDMTVRLVSGLLLPLDFFPSPLHEIFAALPFKYIYFVPVQIYLGRVPEGALLAEIGIGLLWLLLMLVAAHLLFATGSKRMTIQGG